MDTTPLIAPAPKALAQARALYDELCQRFTETGHAELEGMGFAINIAMVYLGIRPGYLHHEYFGHELADATVGLPALTAILARYGLRAVECTIAARPPIVPELFIYQSARHADLASDLRIMDADFQARMKGEASPKGPSWGRLLGYRTPSEGRVQRTADDQRWVRNVTYNIRMASTPPTASSRRGSDYIQLWGYGCSDPDVDFEAMKEMGDKDHAVIRAAVGALSDRVVVELEIVDVIKKYYV